MAGVDEGATALTGGMTAARYRGESGPGVHVSPRCGRTQAYRADLADHPPVACATAVDGPGSAPGGPGA